METRTERAEAGGLRLRLKRPLICRLRHRVAYTRACMYDSAMVLNVRLTPEEVRAVRGLRRAKVNVSELVRSALRQAARESKVAPRSPSAVVRELIIAFPGPPSRAGQPALDDARALRAFITRKLVRQ